jgi:hypothetical protein
MFTLYIWDWQGHWSIWILELFIIKEFVGQYILLIFVRYIPLSVPKGFLHLQLAGFLVVYVAANLCRNIM